MPNCHCPFMCRVQDSDIFYIQRRQTLNKLYESLLCIVKRKNNLQQFRISPHRRNAILGIENWVQKGLFP